MPALAQDNISEAYFHELRGMEDSSGVTHLFYRMFTSQDVSCTDMDGYTSNIGKERNHIYHFDTSILEDSVEFMAGNSISPGCSIEWNDTERFIFTDNHPDSTFVIRSTLGGLYGWYYFSVNGEHQFTFNVGNPLGISFDKALDQLIITTPFGFIVTKAKNKDEDLLRKSFRYSREDTEWQTYSDIFDLPDSLIIDFTVTGVNPYKTGHYVGIKDSNLVLSTDHGNTTKILVKHPWDEDEIYFERFEPTYFDADSNSFYITIDNSSRHFPFNGKEIFLVKQETDDWDTKELSEGYQSFRFALDTHKSGTYYFSSNDSLLQSTDFGETTSLITTFSNKITGLYKKPNSDILYILTREELLEMNTQTKESTSLKKLPVSNEPEPAELPNKITLEQNYPNPFNPSTVISYQLNSNQLVRLEVFDVTGRKVGVLLDGERKSPGRHQVTFNGSGLSSGLYFYRMEAGGQTITQKMLLVK